MSVDHAALETFEGLRPRLLAVAYGMLGSIAEAEDVVQDAWFRWAAVDHAEVEDPAAYLTTVVTRLTIDRLRSAQRRRETYVGTWLPEPIVTELDRDPAEVVAEAEQLSLALLCALERLDPVARAVLLLRDVFDLDYTEVARIVERSPANCRQIAVRARRRVAAAHGDRAAGRPTRRRDGGRSTVLEEPEGRPPCRRDDGRSTVLEEQEGRPRRRRDDRRSAPPAADAAQAVLAEVIAAAVAGDVARLTRLLADDVTAWSDGGGRRPAARQPVVGAARVARFFVAVVHAALSRGVEGRVVRANGGLAVLGTVGDQVDAVIAFDIRDGRVVGIRSVLAPDKLTRVPY